MTPRDVYDARRPGPLDVEDVRRCLALAGWDDPPDPTPALEQLARYGLVMVVRGADCPDALALDGEDTFFWRPSRRPGEGDPAAPMRYRGNAYPPTAWPDVARREASARLWRCLRRPPVVVRGLLLPSSQALQGARSYEWCHVRGQWADAEVHEARGCRERCAGMEG